MKTIRKPRWMLAIMLIVFTALQAHAVDYSYTHTSGTKTLTITTTSGNNFKVSDGNTTYAAIQDIEVTGGNLTLVFNTTGIVHVKGQIKLTKGTLTLKTGSSATFDHSHLKRHSTNSGYLILVDNASTNVNNCKLYINGTTSGNFSIHGNANWSTDYTTHTATLTSGGSEACLINIKGGTVQLNYVSLTSNWNDVGNASGINIDEHNSESKVTIDHCLLQYLYCHNSGAAIHTIAKEVNGKTSSVILKNSTVQRNYAQSTDPTTGGCIRSYGSNYCTMEVTDCTFQYNCSRGSGGVFHWNTGRVAPLQLTRCTMTNNWTGNGGGAVLSLSRVDMYSCTIKNNEAATSGGGIHYGTYSSETYIPNFHPIDGTLTLDANTVIENNTAQYGGGVNVEIKPITIKDHDGTHGGTYTVYTNDQGTTYCVNLNINGAIIRNNTATIDGGGVRMTRNTTIYGTDLNLNYGTITNNTANRNGGGLHVSSGISVNVGTTSGSNLMNITKNTAVNGGGIYLTNGNIVINRGNIGLSGVSNISQGGNGGGVYVTNGNLTMYGGSVGYNQAKKVGNAGGNGGAFYVSNGNVNVTGGTILYNMADVNGGGVYASSGTFNLTNCAVDHNNALGNGGGFYVTGGTATVNGGSVTNNTTSHDGGGFYVNAPNSSSVTTVKGGVNIATNTAVNGAGAYINQGQLKIQDAGTSVASNTATTSGGGIYMASGTVTFTNAKMQSNTATNNDGGGLYLANGNITVSGDNATINGNKAKNRGGGIYVGGGSFSMSGGTIGGTRAQGNSTTATPSYGGGLYMGDGDATLTGGSISGNTATEGYGGGIYMEGGTCTLKSGANIGGENATYANDARFGGGLYSAGGEITVKGGHIDHNIATADGGGIYSNGPEAKVLITKEGTDLSYMQYNTAVNGGGIYANRGSVEFTDGNVNYNYASQAGGGMYVNDEGTLYLKGNAILSRNHVPTGKLGGGVYLRGTVVVGEASKAETSILAEDNFAFTTDTPETYVCDNTTRNNIYLPEPVANPYTSDIHRDVITVIEDGIGANSHVGFSVPRNHVPVIYCERSSTSWAYLDRFTTGPEHDLNTRLFDDTEHYLSVHYTGWPEAFDPDHVYLYGFWPEAVRSLDDVPDNGFTVDGNTVTISNKEGLAWLISYVNGLNNSEPHNSADLVVNLEADVDMKDFGWVPIGFRGVSGVTPKPFNGTFNGNGHLIEGVNGMVYGQGDNGVVDYGLFGYVTGGTIQDVFVKGMEYYTDNNGNLILGGLIGENTGGIVSNSEVQSKLLSQSAQTLIGGLVGKQTGGTVHSSIGIADMTGGRMGGLIGENNGDLYNSFSNSKFTSKDANKYSGGLVAVNNGTVENCYARLRGDAPSGNFGILVGDNTDGEVNYCYAPAGMTNYKAAGAAPTGHGNYGDSFLPYLYRHRDTQVSLADDNDFVPSGEDVDKQMLIALNNWVNEMSTEDMAYTKWGRPWQVSDDLKPLNDDYPILRMPLNDAVAAKAGDPYLYYGPIDTLLVKYTADEQAIWMYRNNSNVQGTNVDAESKLYIAEDVALIHNDSINAYVGITLDNSAGVNGANPQGGVSSVIGIATDSTDWHMISTSLGNAPIGIDYTTDVQYPFSYGHPSGMPYYRFYPKDSDRHGYFPSHRFGTDYPNTDTSIEEGGANYYTEWDFYSYDEPQYHWINFKRNRRSHWHIDDPEHEWQITYENESKMIPGKGYFAATREETFLQCYGTLNYAEINDTVTQTSGVPRHGYNLLGNPYQAYLDFKAFVEANIEDNDAIWNSSSTASYTIINEDVQGYQTFAYQSSYNPDDAGRFIHPHQGFFVLLRDRDGAKAYFYPDMRNAEETTISTFRGEEQPNYPLVNLFVSEANGNTDMVTVELGRPDEGGAPLMQALRTGNGKIWCHYNDEDWAIAFTQPGITEVGIRFESAEDTEYTLRWNTHNGEFNYLHLIDNMTGANVDCLSESEYKFSSSTSDYKSRFKLVFGYTGIEEDTEAEIAPTFAFMMGDEMVVNGEGVLQVFDMNGRLVTSRELHGVQNTVALPEIANGVYVLRLTEGTQSRVQKMVISK